MRISDYEPESQGRRAIRQAGISTGSESVTDPWLEIGIPQEPRASKLQDGLEASLLAWAAALPGPLAKYARSQAIVQGDSTRQGNWRLTEINPVLVGIPWLFWELFAGLSDEVFSAIAFGGACLGLASILEDHLVDRQVNHPQGVQAIQKKLYEEALLTFQLWFTPEAPFWAAFQHWTGVNQAAWAHERALLDDPCQLSTNTLEILSQGKAAPVMITLSALGGSQSSPDFSAAIQESVLESVKASILGDDLLDWEVDLAAHHFTPFLAKLAPLEAWINPAWPTADEIERHIADGWLDVDEWKAMVGCLNRALDAVETVACSAWKAYLKKYRQIGDAYLKEAIGRRILEMLKENHLKAGEHA